MSEIKEMMPVIAPLLAAGSMPTGDQVRRMLVVIDEQVDEHIA
jgi:hypothetical protein